MVKRLFKAVWRLGQPLRRALAARFDRQLAGHFQAWFARVEQVHAEQQHSAAEMELVADAMVRELVRLQTQIRGLHEAIVSQAAAPSEEASSDRPRNAA
ncbi:MAG TPA: hypothetical protein PK867_07180 [Pirellulales bacterium]|nr:hypothetical protein [Pirellulales bacterium]